MAPQRGRPRKPLTHDFLKSVKVLPDIPTLCRQLGYEVSNQPRYQPFFAAVSAQAENIIPAGSKDQFLKWGNRDHRQWLITGTTSFLEKDGRGGWYWPDNSLAENYGKLQYEKDKFLQVDACDGFDRTTLTVSDNRIQRAMAQLLFQIDQTFKNGYRSVASSQRTQPPAWDDSSAVVPNGTIVLPFEIENAHHQREGIVENPIDAEIRTPLPSSVSPLGLMRRLSLNTLSDVPGTPPNTVRSHQASVEDVEDDHYAGMTRTRLQDHRLGGFRNGDSSPDELANPVSPRINIQNSRFHNAYHQQDQRRPKRPARPSHGEQHRPVVKRNKGKAPIYTNPADVLYRSRNGQGNVHSLAPHRVRLESHLIRYSAPVNAVNGESSRGLGHPSQAVEPAYSMAHQAAEPEENPPASNLILTPSPAEGGEDVPQHGAAREFEQSPPRSQMVPVKEPGPSRGPPAEPEVDFAAPPGRPLSRNRHRRGSSRRPGTPNRLRWAIFCSVLYSEDRASLWSPPVAFDEMTLAWLEKEIPLRHGSPGFAFALEMPEAPVLDHSVLSGDEDDFRWMLTRFSQRINAFINTCADFNRRYVFEIVIRPLRDTERVVGRYKHSTFGGAIGRL